jgi:hypothetical protein
MATKKKTLAGALHGVMRGNLRQNRDRRYAEAVERQAKYNDKHGRNLCERGCAPNQRKEDRKVIECVKPIKKVRKHKVRKNQSIDLIKTKE